MNRKWQRRKKLIQWALAVVLGADAVLVVVNWRPGQTPEEQRRELAARQRVHDLLAADAKRLEGIRERLPDAQSQGDKFFSEEFREASSGYSAVVADLGNIAKKAALATGALSFRQREVANRGMVEVEVAGTIEGDYAGLVRFINGLERSENFYLLDNLTLASSAGGKLKLNLQLRTYFRS